MSTTTELYYASTITQAVGEGGIATGGSPLAWGKLGISVNLGTCSGFTVTKTGAFTNYVWASGDVFVAAAGTGMTLNSDYPVASRDSANQITLSTTTTGGSGIIGYIRRDSLAGAIANYPTSLPAPDDSPSALRADFASYIPPDETVNNLTKMLRFSGWKRTTDNATLATVLSTNIPTTIGVGFGFRINDFNQDGPGSYFQIKEQLRTTADGAYGSTINRSDIYADGGLAPSGNYSYYVPPGTIDAALTATVAQASDAGFGLNLQVCRYSGDAFTVCSMLGVNGMIMKLTKNYPDAGGTGRARSDRPLGFSRYSR